MREEVPFTLFEDWSVILEKVKEIVEGKTTVHEMSAQGVEEFKRAITMKS